ncbi:hypothetical protein Syun_014809 [Stephania yunnanensis]|uniref:Uncharacterized protein n=1 Tax=Stephania yunnanensis TaxID=152371 RepID=A0AAP0JKC9_9MAGN
MHIFRLTLWIKFKRTGRLQLFSPMMQTQCVIIHLTRGTVSRHHLLVSPRRKMVQVKVERKDHVEEIIKI